jgi:hypothetical protein
MGMDNDDYIEPEDDYNEEGDDGDDGDDGIETEEIVQFFLLLEQHLKDSKFEETAKLLDDIEPSDINRLKMGTIAVYPYRYSLPVLTESYTRCATTYGYELERIEQDKIKLYEAVYYFNTISEYETTSKTISVHRTRKGARQALIEHKANIQERYLNSKRKNSHLSYDFNQKWEIVVIDIER